MDEETQLRLIIYCSIAAWFILIAAYNYGQLIKWEQEKDFKNRPVKIVERVLEPTVLRYAYQFDMHYTPEHLRNQMIERAHQDAKECFGREIMRRVRPVKIQDDYCDPSLAKYELRIIIHTGNHI